MNALAFPDGIGGQDRLLPTGRLEAFSDGVFAIAITLLVLELHVPGQGEVLVQSLEHEWPRYLAYVVSFAFIGGMWVAHSNMTRFIKAADPALMRLNLTLLLFVSRCSRSPRRSPRRTCSHRFCPSMTTRAGLGWASGSPSWCSGST